MRVTGHPEKYIGLKSSNEVDNTSIRAAESFRTVMQHFGAFLGFQTGDITAGAPGSGAEVPLSDMLAEGVDRDAVYQLSIKLGSETVNIGESLSFFRQSVDMPRAFTQIISPVMKITENDVIAAVVMMDAEFKARVNQTTRDLIDPAMRQDGGW